MDYRVKYTASQVAAAITKAVSSLQAEGILAQDTVYIVLMNGGTWFASHVFDRLEEPHNEVYYVKLHSYEGTNSGTIHWDYLPEMNLEGRNVVVLDDICDTGKTDTAFYQYLQTCRPSSVTFFTLLKRTTTRLPEDIPLYACIEDNSADFFVGCGLDDNAHGRLLPYIGIVEP
jgi:hypoxanthine phosphoribosyltransferase